MSDKLQTYGGQAVIEGVMMRGSKSVAIAMRSPDNTIELHIEELSGIYKSKIAKIPLLRGLIMLWDALGLGMRALTISANMQTGEDEPIEGPALYLTLAFSLALGVGLFFLAPAYAGQLTEQLLGWNSWFSNLFEGVVRLILFIGYVWGIGFMEDIKRVFMYHGAEHKTINAFEAGDELTPEIVAKYPIEHPRCGTAFLLNVVVISILVFTFLGPLPTIWRLVSRVAFLPIIAGIAYEYLRWSARNLDNKYVQWLIKPNLALQHLTTSEPPLDIIEVGIAAFNAMRSSEKDQTDIVT